MVKAKEKNVGIELLRIISKIMVVTLHCLGHGGVLGNTEPLSVNNNMAWLLEIASCGAVDLYALITGFVCVNAKYHYGRIVELWIQVMLYSVIITLVFNLPCDSFNSIKQILLSFFPVLRNQYWFFTSYVALFFFMPFLSTLAKALTKKDYQKFLILCMVFYCVFATAGRFLTNQIYSVDKGYSCFWLMIMYMAGAYIRIYDEDIRKYPKAVYLEGYVFGVVTTWCIRLLLIKVTISMYGEERYTELLTAYNSPFIVASAVGLFLFFAGVRVSSPVIRKWIEGLAAVSFGVYIISEQHYIRDRFITGHLIKYAGAPWYMLLLNIAMSVVVIYFICSIMDRIRKMIFDSLLNRRKGGRA